MPPTPPDVPERTTFLLFLCLHFGEDDTRTKKNGRPLASPVS
jgi:hypothetical protein